MENDLLNRGGHSRIAARVAVKRSRPRCGSGRGSTGHGVDALGSRIIKLPKHVRSYESAVQPPWLRKKTLGRGSRFPRVLASVMGLSLRVAWDHVAGSSASAA